MTIESAGRAVIEAGVEACWAGATDFGHWTDWARDIEWVKLVEVDGDRRRVEFGVELVGKDYGATIDFDLSKGPAEMTFGLVQARKLRTVDGLFSFAPAGAGETLMTFRVTANLVKEKTARIERLFARRIETMLSRDLARHIERANRRR